MIKQWTEYYVEVRDNLHDWYTYDSYGYANEEHAIDMKHKLEANVSKVSEEFKHQFRVVKKSVTVEVVE